MTAADFKYVGNELELFARVVNWKSYFTSKLRPYIRGAVLEVGAGLGETTLALARSGKFDDWTCLEPDPSLAANIRDKIASGKLPAACRLVQGFLSDLPRDRAFDTIIYVDVMEHIADDQAEFAVASQYLAPGGRLIVVSPAHMWLYSPFDEAIGHFRRYNRRTVGKLCAPGVHLERVFYLDSIGLAASLANRLLLKQSVPTPGQLRVWDGLLIPLSRIADALLGYRFGKQIVAVWERRAA